MAATKSSRALLGPPTPTHHPHRPHHHILTHTTTPPNPTLHLLSLYPNPLGVLLQRLISDPTLAHVSHVIVDEVHERGLSEDLLLIKLKHLLMSGDRPDLRVVVMSATLNAEVF